MRFKFGSKHNSACLFKDVDLQGLNALQYLSVRHPNIMAAVKAFEKDWEAREMPDVDHELLFVTLFIDHCGGTFMKTKQRIAKTKSGYSAAIVMAQNELFDGQEERSVSEIVDTLDDKMMEIIRRPTFARSAPDV